MAQVIKATFQLRRGLLEVWEKNNPILAKGEPSFVIDKNALKIGDGVTPWKELEYISLNQAGEDYVLTDADKAEIAEMAAKLVDVTSSGGNVSYNEAQELTDEQKIQARENIGAQPIGNYLTEVPEGYAKTEDIPRNDEIVRLIEDNAYRRAETDAITNKRFNLAALAIKDEYVTEAGVIAKNPGWSRTDFIPIGDTLMISLMRTNPTLLNNGHNAYYDADKKFIYKFFSDDNGFTPDNARYVIISDYSEDFAKTDCTLIFRTGQKANDIISSLEKECLIYLTYKDMERGTYSADNGQSENTKRVRLKKPVYLKAGTKIHFETELYTNVYELSSESLTGGNLITGSSFAQRTEYTMQNSAWLYLTFANGKTAASSTSINLQHLYGTVIYTRLPDVTGEMAALHKKVDFTNELANKANNPFQDNPFMAHFFLDNKNLNNPVIPSQTLYDIDVAHRLGFKVIEANVQKTSDGHYICLHGSSGKFGSRVTHVDGVTDVSDVAVNSVTLEWTMANVRHKSNFAKYRVPPLTLERFLVECKKRRMIPFVQIIDDEEHAIVNKIMGRGNYIAYANERRDGDFIVYHSNEKLSAPADILSYCNSFGAPFIFGILDIDRFTDGELTEIIDLLHKNGYFVSCAANYYSESYWLRAQTFGFDMASSGHQINTMGSGNLCNLSGDSDYIDFTTTGQESDDKIVLAIGDTIMPKEALPTCFLGGGELHLTFNGAVKVTMGTYIKDVEIISDGIDTLVLTTAFFDTMPTFEIEAIAQTEILSILYKASKL